MDLSQALQIATEAALEAGRLLRAEFDRPQGPRARGHHAEVDREVEELLRLRLGFFDWGFRGEETEPRPGSDRSRWWLVDPHDGTAATLQGFRGGAVSIALVEEGQPVLGVVHAFSYPDDDGDLIAWARGCGPPQRRGRPLPERTLPAALDAGSVVFVSQHGDRRPAGNLEAVSPARYRTMPSIAYRLALVAAGEGEAAVSLNQPQSWDYAAGHALLRAVGGDLLDEAGQPVRYDSQGRSRVRECFGGHPEVARMLSARDWEAVLAPSSEPAEPLFPVCLLPGQRVRDAGLLNRAQGCLLGQVAGDSLGGLVEFSRPEAVERLYPGGPRLLEDGGHWGLLAGQPTDDSELALSLARTMLAEGGYRPERAFRAYQRWYGSAPFDVGSTTSQALGLGRPSTRSQANGALMRVSPLGPAGWGRGDEALEWAAADCRLTHPHPFCVAANQLYVGALLMALAGASPREIYDWALGAAGGEAREVLEAAARRPPEDYLQHAGWVRVALHNAFYRLLHASSLEEGVVETVRCGGDTDTNGAITGALLGAVHGRRAVPAQWQRMVLSCRPHPAFRPCRRPRPSIFWPVDVAELAERLLLL